MFANGFAIDTGVSILDWIKSLIPAIEAHPPAMSTRSTAPTWLDE
jgi:hypothetical protein